MGTRPQQMTAHGCSSPTARCRLAQSDFYVCPRDNRNWATAYLCGGYEEYFCCEWGCETTGDAYWQPSSSWDLITVKRNYIQPDPDGHTCYYKKGTGGYANWVKPLLLPLRITFTRSGQQATRWQTGYTWGLRWHLPGKDKGVTFKIKVETTTHSIGPNPVLVDQKSPSQPAPVLPPAAPHNSPDHSNPSNTEGTTPPHTRALVTTPPPRCPGTGDRLLNLVQGAYLALNLTDPGKKIINLPFRGSPTE